MSKYIGTIGQRITAEVTLANEFSYTDYKFSYYGTTHYSYIMHDAEGNVLVWKTTSILMTWDDKTETNDCIRKGDKLLITGTVKEHSEYKEVKQTILCRCKFSLIAHKPDEVAIKREKQMQTLNEGDYIWEMPYRQYKEYYTDCETVSGSYDDKKRTVKVIIRSGRLKKSGVRGEHYSGYQFTSINGVITCYRAISEETARKRLMKDHPNSDSSQWECTKIFRYGREERIW